MDPPCLPLGIYIKSPLIYLNKFYQQRLSVLKTLCSKVSGVDKKASNLNLTRLMSLRPNTHTNSIKDISISIKEEEEFDKDYLEKIKKIKANSFNNKAALDFVDINKSHLPLFITNPPPGFLIEKGTYVQLLVYRMISKFSKNTTSDVPVIKSFNKKVNLRANKDANNVKRIKRKEVFKHTAIFLEMFKQLNITNLETQEATESQESQEPKEKRKILEIQERNETQESQESLVSQNLSYKQESPYKQESQYKQESEESP